jgi:hypothetical protein
MWKNWSGLFYGLSDEPPSKTFELRIDTGASPSNPIVAGNIPPAEEIMSAGIGKFLN